MDAVERVAKVLRKEVPDRVPVGLHNFLMACRMHGGRFDEILRDGAAMAEAQLNFWRTVGHDLLMLEIGVCAEAEALGCKIRYTADGPSHVEEPLVKELDNVEKLAVPDPERTFPLNELLKTTRIVKRETGGKVHVNGRADQGPVALACALVGPQRFLTMLIDPEMTGWCCRLLGFCSRMNLALGEAQRRAGADSSTIGLAGVSLISPAMFSTYELPARRRFARPCSEAAASPSSTPAATRRCWSKTWSPPAPIASNWIPPPTRSRASGWCKGERACWE